MKIVVTGAAGFIGMHLCENLIEKGHAQVKKYSWEKMANETHDIYVKALN